MHPAKYPGPFSPYPRHQTLPLLYLSLVRLLSCTSSQGLGLEPSLFLFFFVGPDRSRETRLHYLRQSRRASCARETGAGDQYNHRSTSGLRQGRQRTAKSILGAAGARGISSHPLRAPGASNKSPQEELLLRLFSVCTHPLAYPLQVRYLPLLRLLAGVTSLAALGSSGELRLQFTHFSFPSLHRTSG